MLDLEVKRKNKQVAISGSSGFVGSELKSFLLSKGYKVVAIKREELSQEKKLIHIIENSQIIINLSGANIISRWSQKYKKTLRKSRIQTTNLLVDAMKKAKDKPTLFISTSAVGIYSNQGYHDEEDFQYADDFLANLCKDWEKSAIRAENLGVRVCIFRFGIVLGKGGALSKMLPAFKLGLGGKIASGKQGFSFIHINDLLKAYEFIFENENLHGVFNLVSPNPISNNTFTKTLGKTLKRPTFFAVPKFALKLILGDGSQVLSSGQWVKPKKLLNEGFEFEFENIEKSLQQLVTKI